MLQNPIMTWDQRYLVDMAQAARDGRLICQDVRRRSNAAVLADARQALQAKKRLSQCPMVRALARTGSTRPRSRE